jgi:DNA repair exonuclease SbcCD ATPase subunit
MELMARFEALPAAKPARLFLIAGAAFAALALLGLLTPWAFLCAVPAAGLLALGIARSQANRKAETNRADILKELLVGSPQEFAALRAALEARARAERALEAASEAAANAKALVEGAERELSELLEKAGAASQQDFRDALKRYEAALESVRALEIRQSAFLDQRNSALDQAEALSRAVRQALASAGLAEFGDPSAAHEALGAHLKRLRTRRETVRALEDAKRLLAQCLNGDDYESLIKDALPEPEPERPQEALAAELEARAARIRALSQEMVACAARRDAIEDSCRTAAEIGGEMALVQEKIDRLSLEAAAIDEAKARIERASDEMRKKVSPALGRAIAEVAGHVTGGRYGQLRIDTDLRMQALADGQTVSPERLSGGTADAIHLALRLGLIEFLMGDRECPVILDDSFAQLDDARAKRMLETIAAFSQNRQALLLTCQTRTRRMLEELRIAHNPVAL